MPTYEYECPSCGVFSSIKPMSKYRDPQPCPECGTHAGRILLSAPAFAGMPGALRQAHATNEHSSHAPKKHNASHGAGCGCCAVKSSTSNADAKSMKSFPGNRPWMISH